MIFSFVLITNLKITMGKGDRKSKRGKIWRGSYGTTRIKKSATSTAENDKQKK